MAAERKLQTAAHAHAADCGDDRLGAAFDRADDGHEMRLRGRPGRTEFPNVRAAGKSRTGADQYDGFDLRIGVRPLDALDNGLAQFQTRGY